MRVGEGERKKERERERDAVTAQILQHLSLSIGGTAVFSLEDYLAQGCLVATDRVLLKGGEHDRFPAGLSAREHGG